MASDSFDDSLDGLLSPSQDDEDFDPGDLIPKYLDRGGRDLLALGAALKAHSGELEGIPLDGENGLRAEITRSWQTDVGEAEDECAFRGDILQLDHILQRDED
jgi:hypothetical protein